VAFSAFVCVLVALNNPDWGLFAVGGHATTYFAFFFSHREEGAQDIRQTLLLVRSLLLGAATGISLVFVYVWLRSGMIPDFSSVMTFPTWMGSTSNMVPLEKPGIGLAMSATFLASSTRGLFLLRRTSGSSEFSNSKPLLSSLMLVYTGITGAGMMVYPFGRSVEVVFTAMFLWWGLALSLLAKSLKDALWCLKTVASARVVFVSSVVVLAPFALVASSLVHSLSPIEQIQRLSNGDVPNAELQSKSAIAICKDLLKNRIREAMFVIHGGRMYAGLTGVRDLSPFNSSVATGFLQGQTTSIVEVAEKSRLDFA
jgi:hypothetical protein